MKQLEDFQNSYKYILYIVYDNYLCYQEYQKINKLKIPIGGQMGMTNRAIVVEHNRIIIIIPVTPYSAQGAGLGDGVLHFGVEVVTVVSRGVVVSRWGFAVPHVGVDLAVGVEVAQDHVVFSDL